MPLTSEVRRSPEPSGRPLAAADSEERQICTTCFFAESVGLCLCFLPSCAMYKDNAVANVVAEMGRDLVSTTARLSDLFNAVERRCSTLTWTVCTAADSEERQICTTCLFAESVGLCLCFLPSCAMYKDNAVRNVVAEMGRDLVFMITARLSDLSMPLKGEVRRSPVQSARQPIARSGKFVRRAYSRRALDCGKDDGLTLCMLSVCFLMYAFSHRDRGVHFCLRGGWGRGEIWRGIPQWNTKDHLPKPQTATVATAQRPKYSPLQLRLFYGCGGSRSAVLFVDCAREIVPVHSSKVTRT